MKRRALSSGAIDTRRRGDITGAVVRSPRFTTAGERITILVVDDDVAIRETLADALDAAGYRAVSARNGREGLSKFEGTNPRLVITDVMMPHIDGREMVRAIRRTDAGTDVPVILMSAAHDLAEEEGVGHDLFLAKPFDIDRLLDHVRELLASKSGAQGRSFRRPGQCA